MKNLQTFVLLFAFVTIASCKKDADNSSTTPTDTYSSLERFHEKNGAQLQTFTINSTSGGSFTTVQGTYVTIPPNAFVTQAGLAVTSNVTIQFKDIYKKSDMLLSDMPTVLQWGVALNSGGEFFIKAVQNNSALKLIPGKKINIAQPGQLTGGADTLNRMKAFLMMPIDTPQWVPVWTPAPVYDTIWTFPSQYVYGLYEFTTPEDSGTWGNTDDPTIFSVATLTNLTIHPTDNMSEYQTEVFIAFSDVNTMIHTYYTGGIFPYTAAPLGYRCTIVAVALKNGKLYSSFTPVTITSNMTVDFTLSPSTTSEFKAALDAIN